MDWDQTLRGLPMGKNMIGKVPHDVATRLNLSNPEDYTFHSYRRTSATSAANGGMTSEQMQGFFGWKHAAMCQEYISTSNPAIRHMAQTLGSFDLSLPEVEEEERAEKVLLMVEEEQNDNGGSFELRYGGGSGFLRGGWNFVPGHVISYQQQSEYSANYPVRHFFCPGFARGQCHSQSFGDGE